MSVSITTSSTRSLTREITLVLGGVFVLAIAAQIRIPVGAVPFTLQTLAVVLIGYFYGATRGFTTVLAYLAAGLVGAPIFAGATGGAAVLTGATIGFLVGMPFGAALAGRARSAGGFIRALILAVAFAFPFVPGLVWLAYGINLGWAAAWTAGAAPFLIPEALKFAVALGVTGVFGAVTRRS